VHAGGKLAVRPAAVSPHRGRGPPGADGGAVDLTLPPAARRVPAIMVRKIHPWAAAIVAALVIGSSPSARAQKHPYYDDTGTLSWHTTFAAAKAAAKRADKLIFVEVGAKT
jgi:hypothetical protein